MRIESMQSVSLGESNFPTDETVSLQGSGPDLLEFPTGSILCHSFSGQPQDVPVLNRVRDFAKLSRAAVVLVESPSTPAARLALDHLSLTLSADYAHTYRALINAQDYGSPYGRLCSWWWQHTSRSSSLPLLMLRGTLLPFGRDLPSPFEAWKTLPGPWVAPSPSKTLWRR